MDHDRGVEKDRGLSGPLREELYKSFVPEPLRDPRYNLDNALVNWRQYIVDLTDRVTQQSDKVIVASIDEKAPLQLVSVEERQSLKNLEDQIIDIILVLDTTSDFMLSLYERYLQFCCDMHREADQLDDGRFDVIGFALQEKRKDVLSNRRKVDTIHAKVKGTMKLLSSLLDLGNGHSVKQLAEEANRENSTMRRLTEKSTQDAAAVKVLTIITLIYLPVTVVSNFFSTQFVSQEQHDGGSTHLTVTSNVWIFAAISAPLTLGTFAVWWMWTARQVRSAASSILELSPLQTIIAAPLNPRQPSASYP